MKQLNITTIKKAAKGFKSGNVLAESVVNAGFVRITSDVYLKKDGESFVPGKVYKIERDASTGMYYLFEYSCEGNKHTRQKIKI